MNQKHILMQCEFWNEYFTHEKICFESVVHTQKGKNLIIIGSILYKGDDFLVLKNVGVN